METVTEAPQPDASRSKLAMQGREMKARQWIGLIAGPAVLVLVLLLPAPDGLSDAGWSVAAVGLTMAVWWMTEALPIAATSLLPLVLFPVLGIADIGASAAPYANPLIFLFMGGFLIALAMERWSLHRRLALGIINRIDYVTANADQIEVANMSLGCECSSDAMDTAISNSVAAGVTYAVAAGNSDADAATFSPANHPDVITVSALADFDGEPGGLGSPTCRTDEDDTLANFSNFGSTIEIAAPGVCILSTWNDGGYNTISGTSMASPHAAGAAALLASTGSYSPDQIRSTLINNDNFNWTDDSGDGIQEPLLDVSNATVFDPVLVAGGGDSGGTTNSPPTASFTFSCTGLTCNFDGSGSIDSDGTISSYDWGFGDGTTASGATVTHTYASGGTYTVTLTVTDDGGATDSQSQSVSVSDGSSSGISLTATGYKVKGLQKADLEWSGASSTNVDVHRDGSKIATTGNDGFYTDNIDQRGGGSYTYKVCEEGTATCSNEATVTF